MSITAGNVSGAEVIQFTGAARIVPGETGAMGKWKPKAYKLKANHGWRAKPGYKIFVADRGAVRFDIPQEWVMSIEPDAIKFRDREQPDDRCLLQVTIFNFGPGADLSELPVVEALEASVGDYEGEALFRGEVVHVRRPDLELAWIEMHYIDPGERREAYARHCLARAKHVAPLMTLDYWPEDADWVGPIWDEILRSLQLGMTIKNPQLGR